MTKQEKFVSEHYDAAIETQLNYGVPYQVTLAQGALESAWGTKAPGNMYFGVKVGKSWPGKKQLLWTHEYKNGIKVKIQDWFRAYDSAYESFKDHADTLKRRFPVAFNYKKNPDEFIRSMQRDHQYKYATDPDYVKKIISIMARINQIIQDLGLNNNKKVIK